MWSLVGKKNNAATSIKREREGGWMRRCKNKFKYACICRCVCVCVFFLNNRGLINLHLMFFYIPTQMMLGVASSSYMRTLIKIITHTILLYIHKSCLPPSWINTDRFQPMSAQKKKIPREGGGGWLSSPPSPPPTLLLPLSGLNILYSSHR